MAEKYHPPREVFTKAATPSFPSPTQPSGGCSTQGSYTAYPPSVNSHPPSSPGGQEQFNSRAQLPAPSPPPYQSHSDKGHFAPPIQPPVQAPYPSPHPQPVVMSYPQAPYPQVMHQPQAMAPMQVAPGGNRNANNKPYGADGQRDWSNGLCSCFGDCGTCCLAFWCPCIAYSQNKHRVDHLERTGFPHPEGGESCSSDCCVYTLLGCFGFGWVLQIGIRNDIRRRYRIEGGGCGDCCTSCCCTPCELTQSSREIELEENSFKR